LFCTLLTVPLSARKHRRSFRHPPPFPKYPLSDLNGNDGRTKAAGKLFIGTQLLLFSWSVSQSATLHIACFECVPKGVHFQHYLHRVICSALSPSFFSTNAILDSPDSPVLNSINPFHTPHAQVSSISCRFSQHGVAPLRHILDHYLPLPTYSTCAFVRLDLLLHCGRIGAIFFRD
jgi:hypothetical protein